MSRAEGLTGTGTYVGFGAIQAGLFLYEAYRSGNFGRLALDAPGWVLDEQHQLWVVPEGT